MLIKKKNLMRLLISSFDATIRVKRAFHPAPASRGFASHVFLVAMELVVPMAVAKLENANRDGYANDNGERQWQ